MISRLARVPFPVYCVLAGLALAAIPGIGVIRLPPDAVFYGFLPPLLYGAAFEIPPFEVRANWREIILLAFGLTAATIFAVGGIAWGLVAALSGASAFVLGAVLAPTDPISATTVIGRSRAPVRLRAILESESLVNDGIGLVAFSIAVTAATHGHFSVGDGVLKFVQLSIGGVAFGLALGFLVERVRRRVHPLRVELIVSVATPYVAYVAADRLGLSGVLSVVAVGVYLGWRFDHRAELLSFWNGLTLLLSSALFVLLGAQARAVERGLHGYSTSTLARDAAIIFAAVVAVRAIWLLVVPHGSVRDRIILGWAGIRGALSLAAAFSIPSTVTHRNEILFLTFTTILGGLLLLAVPFPWLVDRVAHADAGPAEHA